MTRRALEFPHLADWVTTLRPTTAQQYASCVRSFFQARPKVSAAKVGREELVDYCAAIDSPAMRSKTTSALDAYFSYLEEDGHLDRHPAHGLARRVSDARARLALLSDLRSSGVTAREAAALRWRHVAQDVAGPRPGLPRSINNATRAYLVNGLLEKLRSASADTVEAILDRSLLER